MNSKRFTYYDLKESTQEFKDTVAIDITEVIVGGVLLPTVTEVDCDIIESGMATLHRVKIDLYADATIVATFCVMRYQSLFVQWDNGTLIFTVFDNKGNMV